VNVTAPDEAGSTGGKPSPDRTNVRVNNESLIPGLFNDDFLTT